MADRFVSGSAMITYLCPARCLSAARSGISGRASRNSVYISGIDWGRSNSPASSAQGAAEDQRRKPLPPGRVTPARKKWLLLQVSIRVFSEYSGSSTPQYPRSAARRARRPRSLASSSFGAPTQAFPAGPATHPFVRCPSALRPDSAPASAWASTPPQTTRSW